MAQRSWISHDRDAGAPAPLAALTAASHGSLEVRYTGADGEVVLRGELDAYTVPQLDEVLSAAAGTGGPKRIVVDLSQLEFIDVTGVGALVNANNGAHRTGGEIVLRSPRSQTLKLLEITGLNQVFTIEDH